MGNNCIALVCYQESHVVHLLLRLSANVYFQISYGKLLDNFDDLSLVHKCTIHVEKS